MKKLTLRELEIVRLLSEGKSNKEIANQLFISIHTVKSVLEKVYSKFDVNNRVQIAVLYVKEFGLSF